MSSFNSKAMMDLGDINKAWWRQYSIKLMSKMDVPINLTSVDMVSCHHTTIVTKWAMHKMAAKYFEGFSLTDKEING